ncbi:MAG: (2Fe-2S)-binding protein [Acidimicrobiia bacterium]|nr:(2Fe-2S)-binding protein [Acidimicrobiia bacterium]
MTAGGGHQVRLRVNGVTREAQVEPRATLAELLRTDLGLTGTHVGCEHGVCGVCTVVVDGRATRSCLMLAVQADGTEVTTVEGLTGVDGDLHPIQEAFAAEHGLQCGYCTPGILMALHALLAEDPGAGEDEIREVLGGQLCRCTGYQSILRSALCAAADVRAAAAEGER